MIYCAKCGYKNSEEDSFCQECGAALEKKTAVKKDAIGYLPKAGFMGKLEQSVYFKIARGFAWFVIVLTTAALTYNVVKIIPPAIDSIGGRTGVSSDEIKKVFDSGKRRGISRLDESNESDNKKIDPELLSRLDKQIYEITSILPEETQKRWGGVEGLRNHIKFNYLAHWNSLKDQIGVLQEGESLIKDFPETARMDALENFFRIKIEKEDMVKAKKAKAKESIDKAIISILIAIAIITFLTMILVLLTIERNTRKAA